MWAPVLSLFLSSAFVGCASSTADPCLDSRWTSPPDRTASLGLLSAGCRSSSRPVVEVDGAIRTVDAGDGDLEWCVRVTETSADSGLAVGEVFRAGRTFAFHTSGTVSLEARAWAPDGSLFTAGPQTFEVADPRFVGTYDISDEEIVGLANGALALATTSRLVLLDGREHGAENTVVALGPRAEPDSIVWAERTPEGELILAWTDDGFVTVDRLTLGLVRERSRLVRLFGRSLITLVLDHSVYVVDTVERTWTMEATGEITDVEPVGGRLVLLVDGLLRLHPDAPIRDSGPVGLVTDLVPGRSAVVHVLANGLLYALSPPGLRSSDFVVDPNPFPMDAAELNELGEMLHVHPAGIYTNGAAWGHLGYGAPGSAYGSGRTRFEKPAIWVGDGARGEYFATRDEGRITIEWAGDEGLCAD